MLINQTGIALFLIIILSCIVFLGQETNNVLAQNNQDSSMKKPITKDMDERNKQKIKFQDFPSKIDTRILEILTSADPSKTTKKIGMNLKDDKLAVYIYLKENNTKLSIPKNIQLTGKYENILVAQVNSPQILQLSELEFVEKIGVPHRAVVRAHDISEGVFFSKAENLPKVGIDGEGVAVAIIDDSFFLNNPEIQSNIVSSQLIDSEGFCGGSISCGMPVGGSHGTAVAETIVDMAPGVDLHLYAIGNDVDFNNAMIDAFSKNVDIINISLGFPLLGGNNGDYRDGTSSVAQKVNSARNVGILPVVSIGNQGLSHWQGTYSASTVTPASIGLDFFGDYQSVMNFQPNANGIQKACLPVTDNGDIYVASWDAWPSTFQDYDFFLFDSSMSTVIDFSIFPQSDNDLGPLEPLELIFPGDPEGNACLVLASFSSNQNHFFHIDAESNTVDPSLNVRSGSLDTPADAWGSFSVGAVNWTIDEIEEFSSSGPTDDGRNKPEICGPDNTLTHQTDIDSGLNPFLGTSVSAAHVSGGASLMIQQNPEWNSPFRLSQTMIENARYNPNYSIDNLCGSNSGTMFFANPATPFLNLKFGSTGSGDAQFNSPSDIAIGLDGSIYVSDSSNNRIQKFDSSGIFQGWLGKCSDGQNCNSESQTSLGFTCTDSTCNRDTGTIGYIQNGQFATPGGLTIDNEGNLLVADRSPRIQKFDPSGNFLLKFGSLGYGDGQLNYPQDLAVDGIGNIYVTNDNNNRVDKFNSTGDFQGWLGLCTGGINCDIPNQKSFGFTCTLDTCERSQVSGNDDGQFSKLYGIAIDDQNNVYASDDHRIQKFNSNGDFIWGVDSFSDPASFRPYRMTFGSNNNLYVINGAFANIQIYDQNGNFQNQFGTLGSGEDPFILSPLGLASDEKGNFAVSDFNPARIQTFVMACFPPSSGDWIVTSSCSVIENSLVHGNLIVQNNSVLTIPDGVKVTINSGNNLTVKHQSGVLIKNGGTLQVNS
jgi:subtilisin family serine protease